MSRDSVSSIWLVPCAEDTARLKSVVDDIAAAQNGVSFQPHLTLGSLETQTPHLARIHEAAQALSLNPIEIDGTSVFTTSLFIRFETSPELARLRSSLEQDQAFRASRAFDPHLSLCYGPPPKPFDDHARYASLLTRPIWFDQLWAMEIELPVSSHDDVASWRVIDTCQL